MLVQGQQLVMLLVLEHVLLCALLLLDMQLSPLGKLLMIPLLMLAFILMGIELLVVFMEGMLLVLAQELIHVLKQSQLGTMLLVLLIGRQNQQLNLMVVKLLLLGWTQISLAHPN